MKNVNSFSAAVRGIEYESRRQIEVLENGGVINQETRKWDDAKGISILMRTKEDADDYRYFPEPDLKNIYISDEEIAALAATIPELPNKKLIRYIDELCLPETDARLIVESKEKSAFFEEAVSLKKCSPKSISNWLLTDVNKYLNENHCEIGDIKLTAENLVSLIEKIEDKTISASAARSVIGEMIEKGTAAAELIEKNNLAQNSNEDEIKALAERVIADNEKSVTDYKNGKTNALGYLVGQCMKLSKGKANPALAKKYILELLEK
jgi:aspartyl-tRNA(Asn)/glutamyl-tRNA(Gln) amidotransferase subunit B